MATYQTDDVWSAVADTTRRAILEKLAAGPLPVGELARTLPVSRPAVSQHLKVLKDAGLVLDHAAGTRRLYQLNPTGMEVLRQQLDHFWMQALTTFQQLAESEKDTP